MTGSSLPLVLQNKLRFFVEIVWFNYNFFSIIYCKSIDFLTLLINVLKPSLLIVFSLDHVIASALFKGIRMYQ